jgi:MFS family permease
MGRFIDGSLLKRNPNYALLYSGQFISFIGTMITIVALPYQIYHITQSTLMVGLLSVAQLIPLLFTALLGGVLADRCNRRTLVMFSEGLLILGCGVLAWNAGRIHPSLVCLFVTASGMSAITGLHRPAFESMTQQLVSPKDYKSVGALMGFKYSFCMIIGPALAGLIIAYFG